MADGQSGTLDIGRLEWLDVAKGIGILLVVAGHVLVAQDETWMQAIGRFIYLFHMPFFFFVAGYTLRDTPFGAFAFKRFLALLGPYAVALTLMGIPAVIYSCTAGAVPLFGIGSCPGFAVRLMAGGASIGGIFGVFWFVTCLFVALLIAQGALKIAQGKIATILPAVITILYCVGYLLPLVLPVTTMIFGLGIAPMAAVFILCGFLIRRVDNSRHGSGFLLAIGLLALAAAFILPQEVDMKQGLYGAPVVGLMIGAGLSILLGGGARLITAAPPLADALFFLGARSMSIMYFHQLVHYTLRALGIDNAGLLIIFAVALPLAFAGSFDALVKLLQHRFSGTNRGETVT